jgi:hypothetical protein
MLNNMQIETGIDLRKLVLVGESISRTIGRENQSKAGKAIAAKN